MTEPEGGVAVAETAATEPTAETPSAGRGRPRPSETIERDDKVYAALEQPGTRAQLIERTGLAAPQVYLSLWRLNRDKRVERARDGSSHVWSRVAEQPAALDVAAE